jgi:hypothetical protein
VAQHDTADGQQGVYAPLREYLRSLGRESVTLTYAEIERILGRALPETATKRRQWWENDRTMHPQAGAWLDAGMQLTDVGLGDAVTFDRRD